MKYRSRISTIEAGRVLVLFLLLFTSSIYAQSIFDQFKDPYDGWFDASDWVLNNAVGFMPVLIIITEPAVGEGLGLAALFFQPPEDYSEEKYAKSGSIMDQELPGIGSGVEAEIRATIDDNAIGSDFDYTKYDASLNKWWNPDPKWVHGLRLDLQYVDGILPFYSVPYIDLRDISALRYQGDAVAVAETEVRWNFHPRVSVVEFLGIGVAAGSFGDFNRAPSRATRGLGLRYMVARKLGMHAGIDVAQGPEDTY